MRPIELTSFNLNFLLALDGLSSERSVTAAARRVGVTPSAMSHSLAELRGTLDAGARDRDPRGMPLDPSEYFASLPKRRMGAGALLLDAAGCVLMVEPVYKKEWEIPGGIVEAGESPRHACRRECREELGLELQVGRVLVLEHQMEAPPQSDSLMLVYDGGVVRDGTQLVLPASELRSHRFVPAERLGEITLERLARRIRFALLALKEGSTIELTNGLRETF